MNERVELNELIQDVELSFKLFEFSVRTMCFAELGEINSEIFGRELQLNLEVENVSFSEGQFTKQEEIILASQMAVSAAFAATAVCLDCALENHEASSSELKVLKSLISAVRNAFAHGIAAPKWYIKKHKFEVLNLNFILGPEINLEMLNGEPFDYSQIGGLALWYRVKNEVIRALSNT